MEKRYAKIAFSFVAGSAMLGVALFGSHTAMTYGGLSAAYAAALDTVQWEFDAQEDQAPNPPVLEVAALDVDIDPTAPTVVYRTIPEVNDPSNIGSDAAEPSVAYRVTPGAPKLRPAGGVVPNIAPIKVAEVQTNTTTLPASGKTIIRDGFVETRIAENRVIIRPVTATPQKSKAAAVIAELEKKPKSVLREPAYQIGVFW